MRVYLLYVLVGWNVNFVCSVVHDSLEPVEAVT